MQPKSVRIYHIPVHLEHESVFGTRINVPNQSEYGKYSLISVWFDKISERFLCVRN